MAWCTCLWRWPRWPLKVAPRSRVVTVLRGCLPAFPNAREKNTPSLSPTLSSAPSASTSSASSLIILILIDSPRPVIITTSIEGPVYFFVGPVSAVLSAHACRWSEQVSRDLVALHQTPQCCGMPSPLSQVGPWLSLMRVFLWSCLVVSWACVLVGVVLFSFYVVLFRFLVVSCVRFASSCLLFGVVLFSFPVVLFSFLLVLFTCLGGPV